MNGTRGILSTVCPLTVTMKSYKWSYYFAKISASNFAAVEALRQSFSQYGSKTVCTFDAEKSTLKITTDSIHVVKGLMNAIPTIYTAKSFFFASHMRKATSDLLKQSADVKGFLDATTVNLYGHPSAINNFERTFRQMVETSTPFGQESRVINLGGIPSRLDLLKLAKVVGIATPIIAQVDKLVVVSTLDQFTKVQRAVALQVLPTSPTFSECQFGGCPGRSTKLCKLHRCGHTLCEPCGSTNIRSSMLWKKSIDCLVCSAPLCVADIKWFADFNQTKEIFQL